MHTLYDSETYSVTQLNTPTQEEVEDTLEQYAELAQNPVVVH